MLGLATSALPCPGRSPHMVKRQPQGDLPPVTGRLKEGIQILPEMAWTIGHSRPELLAKMHDTDMIPFICHREKGGTLGMVP